MTATPTPRAPAGLTVGGYELQTRIGEGGMGVVHLARRPGQERVALKVLRPHIIGDDEARARLAREVSSLSRIRSSWVAEIVDADPWGEIPYVATRYVPGLSLHDHVREEGAVEGAELIHFAGCLAQALAAVHAVGVLHRDIKPSNVLMEGRTPVLIDFGLARVADDPKLTHTGWLLGTPGYLAPEILYGEDASTASDVHSWAATVAFAGLGHAPFGKGPAMAIMDRVRRGQHDLTGIRPELAGLLGRALDPDPAHRPTLEELQARLRPGGETLRSDDLPGPEPVLPEDDPFTLPLALAQEASARPTRRYTEVATVHQPGPPAPPGQPAPSGPPVPAPAQLHPVPAPLPMPAPLHQPAADGYPMPAAYPAPAPYPGYAEPPVAPLAERLRRGSLLVGLALLTGAVTAAFPWLSLIALVLVVWGLRSVSLAGESIGYRRSLRGARWYDAVQVVVSSPWHLLQAVPGTILLVLWAAGAGAVGGLLAYAFAAPTGLILFLGGLGFAVGVWCGPGGSRVRRPVRAVTWRAAGQVVPWAITAALIVGLTVAAWGAVSSDGPRWSPDDSSPVGGR